jgi:uncharacterized protein YgbK (DUF1537 family)
MSAEETTLASQHTNAVLSAADGLPTMTQPMIVPGAIETIRAQAIARQETLVVLDDDPTGSQTLTDVPLLLRWDIEALSWAFRQDTGVFYVLTNSRSMSVQEATDVNREIVANLVEAAGDRRFKLLSRGDSTLRGHFPVETDAIAQELAAWTGMQYEAVLLCPAFLEAGRITAGDIHWVIERGKFIPVASSEFARDSRFGYSNSSLPEWVREMSPTHRPELIVSVGLDDIRIGGPNAVTAILISAQPGSVIVINAVLDADLEIVVLGLLEAEERGSRILYRSGPSFARVRAGMAKRSRLDALELRRRFDRRGEGLLVVGSHVGLTNQQVTRAARLGGFAQLELHVERVLDQKTQQTEADQVVAEATRALAAGKDVLLHTTRQQFEGHNASSREQIGKTVSRALASVVREITRVASPAWLIAKGGITASDVAVHGLGMQRAWMLGQLLDGTVSVWGATTEDPANRGMPFVVFPGNVGSADSLAEVTQRMRDFSCSQKLSLDSDRG